MAFPMPTMFMGSMFLMLSLFTGPSELSCSLTGTYSDLRLSSCRPSDVAPFAGVSLRLRGGKVAEKMLKSSKIPAIEEGGRPKKKGGSKSKLAVRDSELVGSLKAEPRVSETTRKGERKTKRPAKQKHSDEEDDVVDKAKPKRHKSDMVSAKASTKKRKHKSAGKEEASSERSPVRLDMRDEESDPAEISVNQGEPDAPAPIGRKSEPAPSAVRGLVRTPALPVGATQAKAVTKGAKHVTPKEGLSRKMGMKEAIMERFRAQQVSIDLRCSARPTLARLLCGAWC